MFCVRIRGASSDRGLCWNQGVTVWYWALNSYTFTFQWYARILPYLFCTRVGDMFWLSPFHLSPTLSHITCHAWLFTAETEYTWSSSMHADVRHSITSLFSIPFRRPPFRYVIRGPSSIRPAPLVHVSCLPDAISVHQRLLRMQRDNFCIASTPNNFCFQRFLLEIRYLPFIHGRFLVWHLLLDPARYVPHSFKLPNLNFGNHKFSSPPHRR